MPSTPPGPRSSRSTSQQPDPLGTPLYLHRPDAYVTPGNYTTPPPTLKLFPTHLKNNSSTHASSTSTSVRQLVFSSPFFSSRDSVGSSAFSNYSTETKTEDRMRYWRNAALQYHMYETAAFWGNKLASITGNPDDVYWLAQIYFMMGQYARAHSLLWNLLETSTACRILAAECSIKLEKYQEVFDILYEENPPEITEKANDHLDGSIKLEAYMCYLRGYAYAQQANLDQAKKNYKLAVVLDVRCFEAFNALISNHMMTSKEEWEFLNSLEFEEQCGKEDGRFIKMNYMSMLKKYDHVKEIEEAREELEKTYLLVDNADVMLSRAEQLYAQCQFKDCLDVTTKILDVDTHNQACLPIHIACLHELREKNRLFLLSHELVEHYPDAAVTWFSVGCYYYLIGQNDEARKYFSKASTMDSRCGAAWVGFGHSFAVESEHDQAITAYSTASRFSHLPTLFIGMQHLQANNFISAEEYLFTSYQICTGDPLALNELGALYYHKNQYKEAIEYFERALSLVVATKSRTQVKETTWMNLGHAYRKTGKLDIAESYFQKVAAISPPNANALSAIGYIYHIKENYSQAAMYYHEALGIKPSDLITQDLLGKCLESMVKSNQSLID
ncbi:4158_t:CDS:10 [Ambispora gerdemannii]|uniref:4158_t:CDS:1 n=1 Tax=Ambispora gerdemannii TaxID=144530 RepID=A0A9N9BBS8_9GLOM|nr:4158_t:CDS:10 [Ambispora gerdemannii]